MTASYHIITLGCQMNKSDSERVAALLESSGMTEAASPEEADFILLNSCSVRQTAEDRVFGKVNDFMRMKERRPDLVVGVTGCMAGRDTDGRIRAKLPGADLFFPTRDLPQLPKWLAELGLDVQVGDCPEDYLKITPRYSNARQAFVSIQTGCNNFCTYCVVPYARGMEKNRPAADVLAEVRALAESGTLEVTLLGQAVNAYRAPDGRATFSSGNPYANEFAALLWEINQLSGIERMHYTAPHPKHMTDEVIDALALPKHVNYLHLPVQSGSDEVLRRMNRKYSRADFLDVIRRLRSRLPDICLGTDIIVGFCGETEEMFEETVSLYREVGFDIAYIAMYSPRSGTPAWRAFSDDVPREEKRRRWRKLHGVMEEMVREKNRGFEGREVEVLVERCDGETCYGNSREMKSVRFAGGPDLVGRIVKVRITKAFEWVMEGSVI